ncbi:MAG: S41 family peptidase [Bacteroidales bacterium]|nr:S41 family peptidase [Bacteroidales bacterium]
MIKSFTRIFIFFVFIIGLGLKAQQNSNFETTKYLEIYFSLFKEINLNYVDPVNPGTLTSSAIEAMLKTLDPYTVYIPEGKVEDYQFLTTGEFGGIGASVHSYKNQIIVMAVYEEGPAIKAGLKPGDIIREINNREFNANSTEEFDILIKGDPGTQISLSIFRPYLKEEKVIPIVREKIKLKNISYSALMADQIGYIRLERFAEKASQDFGQALNNLRANTPLKGLIIDIRGNGGGLLNEAVNILGYFVPKGTFIVSTKGRDSYKDHSYFTTTTPIEPELPLIIIVDENSASASEILAGSLQDLDRGIVLGHQTYGKGLVQNVIPLAYKAQLKITIAKYYIPSGRCIQRLTYNHNPDEPSQEAVPDSLRHPFKTLNGRVVYDGAGIEPDLSTGIEKMPEIVWQLLSQMMIFNFSTEFAYKNPRIDAAEKFNLIESTYQDFKQFVVENGFKYDSYLEVQAQLLQKQFEEAEFDDHGQISTIQELLAKHKETEFEKYKVQLMRMLQDDIVSRYYPEDGRIKNYLKNDPELEKALQLLSTSTTYNSIIDGSHPESKNKKGSL